MKSSLTKFVLCAGLLAVVGMFSLQTAVFADTPAPLNAGQPSDPGSVADDVRKDGDHKKGGKGKKKKGGKKKAGKKE